MSTPPNTSDSAVAAGTVSAGPGIEVLTGLLTQPDGTTQTTTVNTSADASVAGQEDWSALTFTITQNGNYSLVASVGQTGNFAASSSAPFTFTVSDIALTPRTVTITGVAVS